MLKDCPSVIYNFHQNFYFRALKSLPKSFSKDLLVSYSIHLLVGSDKPYAGHQNVSSQVSEMTDSMY